MPSSRGWLNSTEAGPVPSVATRSELPQAGEALQELVELLRVLQVLDIEPSRDHLRLPVDVHGGCLRRDAERRLHHLKEGCIGKDSVWRSSMPAALRSK